MASSASIRLADRKSLANHIKEKLTEFNRIARDDGEFRKLVLAYFKPDQKVN